MKSFSSIIVRAQKIVLALINACPLMKECNLHENCLASVRLARLICQHCQLLMSGVYRHNCMLCKAFKEWIPVNASFNLSTSTIVCTQLCFVCCCILDQLFISTLVVQDRRQNRLLKLNLTNIFHKKKFLPLG